MMGARAAALIPLVVLLATSAAAQSAMIVGVLRDPSGAPVPGARVEILADGEVIQTVTTDVDGSFQMPTSFRGDHAYELRILIPGVATQRVPLQGRTQRIEAAFAAHQLEAEVHLALEMPPPPPPPPTMATPPPTTAPAADNHAIVKVFYATDRGRVSWSPLEYGPRRNETGTLHLGRFDVSVPRDHKMASVERPDMWTFWREDPDKHFIIIDRKEMTYEGFYRDLSDLVGRSARKEAFVFIHGYNVAFESAVYRTAQIAYDLGFDGAAILYSWPSEGRLAAYPVDLNNNEWTVPHLRWFLEDVAARSGAQVIHLIAHSMGNRALVNAVYRIATEQRATPAPRFSQVILTAPDIDASTFMHLAATVATAAQRVTLYASSNDEALKASRTFQGYQRAGDSSPEVVVVPGIDTVDVSTIDTGLLGHSYYGDNRSVLTDIFNLLREGKEPGLRFGMSQAGQPPRLYWAFRP